MNPRLTFFVAFLSQAQLNLVSSEYVKTGTSLHLDDIFSTELIFMGGSWCPI